MDIFKNSNEVVKIHWKTKQITNDIAGCWELIHKKHRDINDYLGAIFILLNISWEFKRSGRPFKVGDIS